MLELERRKKAKGIVEALLFMVKYDTHGGSDSHWHTSAAASLLGLHMDSAAEKLAYESWPERPSRSAEASADQSLDIVDDIHQLTAAFCDKVCY